MVRRSLAGAIAGLSILFVAYDAYSAREASGLHEQGRAIYNYRCYFCHGYSGDARTLAASFLSPSPRDFTTSQLTTEDVERAVRQGRPGTAMKAYSQILGTAEIQAVAAFVEREFVRDKAPNTAYHTAANGWPNHRRNVAAFPFASGQLALDAPAESMNDEQRQGRSLFMAACVSCHDRGRVLDDGPAWSARPVSFPRMGFAPGGVPPPPVDVVSSASVYAKHEVAPRLSQMSPPQTRGRQLFQANCAFCHGADGTGMNWIGQFMEPKARDLTQFSARTLPPERFAQVIREGLPGSSMPAWASVLTADDIDDVVAYASRAFFKAPP
jgi:cytochrome c oxidase cbb3-type subunit 3